MVQTVFNLGPDDFSRFFKDGKRFLDQLYITEVRGEDYKNYGITQNTRFRLEVFSVLLVRQGQINLTIDGTSYSLSDNCLRAIGMDFHVISDVCISPDFFGYHMIADRRLLAEIMQNSTHLPATYIASWRSSPIQELNTDDADLLAECLRRIEWNIDRSEHTWQRDMVLNELRGFMLEMNNIIYQSLRKHIAVNPPGKDKLLFMFFQLLHKYSKKEHSVSFYAGELYITPEYLSRILKESTGKTVNKWIAEELVQAAEIYLRNINLTIQQVSDLLNFADQSSFGKFFKKNRGMSPLAYRAMVKEDDKRSNVI